MDAIDIGRTGLAAGLRRMTAAATAVVEAGTACRAPGAGSGRDVRPGDATPVGAPAADPVSGLVELHAGRRAAETSLKLIAAAARMERHAVDRWG